jgi:hypothetical protein
MAQIAHSVVYARRDGTLFVEDEVNPNANVKVGGLFLSQAAEEILRKHFVSRDGGYAEHWTKLARLEGELEIATLDRKIDSWAYEAPRAGLPRDGYVYDVITSDLQRERIIRGSRLSSLQAAVEYVRALTQPVPDDMDAEACGIELRRRGWTLTRSLDSGWFWYVKVGGRTCIPMSSESCSDYRNVLREARRIDAEAEQEAKP